MAVRRAGLAGPSGAAVRTVAQRAHWGARQAMAARFQPVVVRVQAAGVSRLAAQLWQATVGQGSSELAECLRQAGCLDPAEA